MCNGRNDVSACTDTHFTQLYYSLRAIRTEDCNIWHLAAGRFDPPDGSEYYATALSCLLIPPILFATSPQFQLSRIKRKTLVNKIHTDSHKFFGIQGKILLDLFSRGFRKFHKFKSIISFTQSAP